MKKILLFSFMLLSALINEAWAQERTISGNVTSVEDGSTMPGVNVVLKGTTNGTITDVDGNYKLSVPSEGGTLTFSFVGLTTEEIVIGTSSTIDLAMSQDVMSLGEIIVSGVAAGTPRKKLTVSVAKVDAERLQSAPPMSAAGALVGKVAGVRINSSNGQPGSGASIQLRSDNNLGVGSAPLIIVDGVMLEGSLADINVDDIESYEIVKGASASALYGSRAGNGVVVIRTKRGNNLGDGETTITVRNEYGIQQMSKFLDVAEHHYFELADDYMSVDKFTKYDGVTYPAGYAGGYHDDIIGSRPASDDYYLDNPYRLKYDQQGDLFQNGTLMTNYASIANRTGATNVFASFENNIQEGVIANTGGYKRQNFRLNLDHTFNDWLTFSASNLYISTNTDQPGGGGTIFFDVVLAEPDNNLNLVNPVDGQPHYVRHNHWSNETNPLYNVYKKSINDQTQELIASYRLKAEITDWVNVEFQYAVDRQNYNYTAEDPYDTWDIGAASDPYGITYTEGYLRKYTSQDFAQTYQTYVNLSKKFGDFTTKAQLSYLFEDRKYEWHDVQASNYSNADIPNLQNFQIGGNAVLGINSWEEDVRAINYFGIVSADYQDKIMFDGMFRKDGSSKFGADNRWNNFFRASAAYRITEDFDIPGVQELKLRGAYGTAGIRPGFDWQYEVWTLSNGGFEKDQLGNKDLKSSNTAETEVALNAEFLNRFQLEAIYAMAKTTDGFLNPQQNSAANGGFRTKRINGATIEGNTLEINLGATAIKTDDLSLNFNLVFTKTKQEITELTAPPYQSGPDGLYFIKEGESYGSIYGRAFVRSLDVMANQLAEGESITDYALNSDGYVIEAGTEGTINEVPIIQLDSAGGVASTVKIGDGLPKFTMGLSTNLNWKGLSFYFLWDWKNGGDVYNRKGQWLTRDDRHAMLDQFGKPEGEKKALQYYKGFYDVNNNNDFWVEDASFLKLREVALSYTLGADKLSGFLNGAFKEVKVSVIGRNLLTFTQYSGYDPEVGSIRNPFDGTGTYPNFRMYSGSVQFKF